MKKNLKTPRIISLFAILFMVAALPNYAQQPDAQFQVSKAETRTNPEFTQRFTDAGNRSATDFCLYFTTNVSVVNDGQNCFLDITYSNTYTYVPGTTNACFLPHGLYVEICPQAEIVSATVVSGAWLSGVTPVISSGSGNNVYWAKPCPTAGDNYSNRIPSGSPPLIVRIKLASGFCPGAGNCSVIVREMSGVPYPQTAWWSCQRTQNIVTTAGTLSIGSNTSICTGNSLTINANFGGPPPPGTIIKWYKYTTPTLCTDPFIPTPTCPIPPSQWLLDQTGGTSYNTNILTQATCYVAIAQNGCRMWVSNVKKVDVCQGNPSASITATGPTTSLIDGINHACEPWSGELCLDISTFRCCPTQIIKWETRSRGLSYPGPCTPVWGPWSPWFSPAGSAEKRCINTGQLRSGRACQTQYEFRAVLENACGQSTPTYTIIIDKPSMAGSITANPLAPLCFDRATRLSINEICGEVLQWEKREEGHPCVGDWGAWTIEAGSQGTCVWWTNNLEKTTQYKVKVKNGACAPVYSPTFTVTVRPKLEVTITANQTLLCPPGVTLTAQTTYGLPCNYPVTYQWFRDGLPIPGPAATQQFYSPTTSGNYYVVVSSICGRATSNVITVCGRPELTIKAPCCICPGETISLDAVVIWTPANCIQTCTYLWNTGATTSSINVTSPGTYTVTVTCGSCPPMTISKIIENCPR